MLTRSGFSCSREIAKILPDTLNTDVCGPNGNVSVEPGNARQWSRSLDGRIGVDRDAIVVDHLTGPDWHMRESLYVGRRYRCSARAVCDRDSPTATYTIKPRRT